MTLNAELIFRNNIVRDNRARGMLVGTPKKVVIENCYFHTSGVAILFESNGSYWHESGATKDVTIRKNRFVDCKYCNWGNGVIECSPRDKTEEDRYFHGSIRAEDNEFVGGVPQIVLMDNAAFFKFTSNTILENAEACVKVTHVGKCEIQNDIKVR